MLSKLNMLNLIFPNRNQIRPNEKLLNKNLIHKNIVICTYATLCPQLVKRDISKVLAEFFHPSFLSSCLYTEEDALALPLWWCKLESNKVQHAPWLKTEGIVSIWLDQFQKQAELHTSLRNFLLALLDFVEVWLNEGQRCNK